MKPLALAIIAATLSGPPMQAQTDLKGVIDIHVHTDPDSLPRSLDAVEAARLGLGQGMRAIVLKNHYEPTASLAYMVRKQVPGIEVFGGIDLNRAVGGINAEAVEHMTRVKGGWGRVVWMPTFDAENQVRYSKENRPFVAIARNGELLPEVKEVIGVVARHQLVLATGHSSPEEGLLLLKEGRRQGLRHMVVTHAMLAPVRMNVSQMREAARLGAFIEFVYNALIGPNKMFDIQEYADAIRQIGPEFCILSSDLGQAGNPLPADGLRRFLTELRAQGFSSGQMDRMSKVNPGKLLGVVQE